MKTIFLAIIILLGYWGFSSHIPPIALLLFFGVLVIVPAVLIIVKKNMLYAFMVWLFFLLFRYGLWGYNSGKLRLLVLPDIQAERLMWISICSIFFFGFTTRKMKFDIGITRLETTMAVFIIYILFSMIISGTFYAEGRGLTMNFLLSGYFIPFSSFFITKYIVNDEQKTKKIFIFFSIMGLYLGLTGIFEYFRLNFLVFPGYIMDPKVGIHWGRARGPLLEAVGNGLNLGMCFFITLHLLLHTNKKWVKIFYSFSMATMLITVLFTFTRNVWLGFAFGSLLMPILLPRVRKIYLISCLALLITAGALFSLGQFKQYNINDKDFGKSGIHLSLAEKIATRSMKKETVEGRVDLYKIGWKMFLKKPFLGSGFATFSKKVGGSMHDALVNIVVELGLVGLSLYLFIMSNLLILSIKLYRQLPPNVFIGKGIVAIFFGIFILYSIVVEFAPFSTLTSSLSIFYCIAGIIVGLHQRASKQEILEHVSWNVQKNQANMKTGKYI